MLDEQLNGRVYSAIYNCAEIDGFDIKELDLSTWDTSHVQACNFEFNGCLDLEVIYVGAGWDMEKVTNSTGMFGSCFKLRNFNGSIIDKTNAHTGDGGYLTYKS